MAHLLIFILVSFLAMSSAHLQNEQSKSPLETYIVHVSLPDSVSSSSLKYNLDSWYHSFLPKTNEGLNDVSRMVYAYQMVITGFAARLSAEDVKEMEKKEGFLYARPQKILTLQTTRSPRFMGLLPDRGLWPRAEFGKGVIIGIIDNGIKADHPSFRDKDMPSPPVKWKGICHLNGTKCNKKLIGARNLFIPGQPVSVGNHGTHTASTAAGNFVQHANVFGNANGTAAGMAPLAHLAIYQAGQGDFVSEFSILAAMEAAILDGVDVLSLSIGSRTELDFYEDSIAIGAFRAIQKGIFVSCAAGNFGPESQTVANYAPWILTVGASSIDRTLRATALLGDGGKFNGYSLSQPKDFPSTLLPLVYGASCEVDSLNNIYLKGKIVVCENGLIAETAKAINVKGAGGVAMILIDQDLDECDIEAHAIPTAEVSFSDGQAIKAYINSTSTPTATIFFRGTVLGVKNAPEVAKFSSRGPSMVSPGILKPDIIGPGVNILAAWAFSFDSNTSTTFSINCGTSVACPHLSGVAALIRSLHPNWTPAAIRSAIMTSADILNLNKKPILDGRKLSADVFAIGAGHVHPSRAADPGLIYDIQPDDYIPYLCGLSYTDTQVTFIVQRPIMCSVISSIPEAQLNYPSFALQLGSTPQTYTRTVTNVGEAQSTYTVRIEKIQGVDVFIKPAVINFTKVMQKLTYQITFSRSDTSINQSYVQGAISWISNKHTVRSPISVHFV